MAVDMDYQDEDAEVATTSTQTSFAQQRSHQDAQASNENHRATAQIAIIINGGAATAVLAFLAKDKVDPNVVRVAAASLGGYVFGVFAGSAMMFCLGRQLSRWNRIWRLRAEGLDDEIARKRARWWRNLVGLCYLASMLSFLFSSAVIAIALYRSTPS